MAVVLLHNIDGSPPLRAGRAAFYLRDGVVYLKIGEGVETSLSNAGILADVLSTYGNRFLPAGGATGQVLKKTAATDYAVTWGDDLTAGGGGGSVAWGAITGTLANQTDLDTALDGKAPLSHTHTFGQLSGVAATGHDQTVTLSSGTYTPSLTNGANVGASTSAGASYMRVGNTVTVSGQLTVDVTTVGLDTILGVSLPIGSDFTVAWQCSGTAATSDNNGQECAAINADTVNNRAQMQWRPLNALNKTFSFSFTYRIV